MECPTIRYARTDDGYRIAFHVTGAGVPLLMLFPYHVNHLRLNWGVPLHRGAIGFLARHFTVINLDFRGAGCSGPGIAELSLTALADDVGAVLRELGIERAALCAMGSASLIGCAYAAAAPARVAGLVLVQAGESEANARLLGLRRINPDVEARSRAALLASPGDKANANALAAVARESLDIESLNAWQLVLEGADLGATAAAVRAPVLCLHAAGDSLVTSAAADALLERFTDGRLLVVPASSGMDIWRSRPALRQIRCFVTDSFGPADGFAQRPAGSRTRGQASPGGLSAREVEVLERLAVGRTNRQIAEDLFISPHTVSYHLRGIFAKTGVANRTEAVSFAHRHGLTGES